MANRNDSFFEKKRSWSEVKDELLAYYLKPYTQKILFTHKPLIYIDCFAGKGRFDDDSAGSPIIALDIFRDCQNQTKTANACIMPYFIDLYYKNELKKNLEAYNNVNIISGKFEEEIYQILNTGNMANVFLYIDPYGINALQFSIFEYLSTQNFYSIELLINFNSFGFIREACRVMNIALPELDQDFFDDLYEYDTTILDQSQKSQQQLTAIAGGEYWIDIIKDYKDGKIDGYSAETNLSEMYCKQLRKKYKYVLNMPVRIRENNRPKYRLVHVTKHVEGCLIMADNMFDKWQILQEIQHQGQGSLFEEDFNNSIINETEVQKAILSHVARNKKMLLEEFIADFFMEHGIIYSTKGIRKIIHDFEINQKIKIHRTPEYTKTGKKSAFMESKNDQKVYIERLYGG
jgi:three-Cys-motif partner protein